MVKKPLDRTVSWYFPGERSENEKSPVALDTVVLNSPVSNATKLIVALTTTAPELSMTVPLRTKDSLDLAVEYSTRSKHTIIPVRRFFMALAPTED
jgi:hypothetical protein